MDNSSWLGLGLGTVIGGAYAWLHLWSLKRSWVRQQQGQQPNVGRQMFGAMLRVLAFAAAMFVALQYTSANKWWLGGSLALAYGVPFLWRLRVLTSQKK
jgi:hypothetical protein